MKRIFAWVWLACVFTVATAQVDPNRIVPGKQLGKLHIGDLMEDLKWLKKPDYGDVTVSYQWLTWEAKKPDPRNGKIINSLDVYSSVTDAGKYQIGLIRSTSPTFSTSDKIKVGSLLLEVKKRFPNLAKVAEFLSPQFSTKVALYDDGASGIAFEFKLGLDGSVGRHEKCLAIWVHEPGAKPLGETYHPIEYLTAKPTLRKAAKHAK